MEPRSQEATKEEATEEATEEKEKLTIYQSVKEWWVKYGRDNGIVLIICLILFAILLYTVVGVFLPE